MPHAFHDALPGFDPEQILISGCAECESRAQWRDRGISSLDPDKFSRAMQRAAEWGAHGLPNISDAELPLLEVLRSVSVQMRRAGAR